MIKPIATTATSNSTIAANDLCMNFISQNELQMSHQPPMRTPTLLFETLFLAGVSDTSVVEVLVGGVSVINNSNDSLVGLTRTMVTTPSLSTSATSLMV